MNKNMLKQAQDLQKQMAKIQEEIESTTVESSSGGGVVKVVVSGKMVVQSIQIEETAVDSEDVELLEEMVLTAINDALCKAQELASSKMNALTGGFNLPGF